MLRAALLAVALSACSTDAPVAVHTPPFSASIAEINLSLQAYRLSLASGVPVLTQDGAP